MTLEEYFKKTKFTPNKAQLDAIQTVDGPLLLVAGPGSGKTRVLLWRAFNLIVFHGVKPSEIFLSTFTEKAAKQLKDGLLTLLGSVHGTHYDLSEMYVGTVHSLCRRILSDYRFNPSGTPTPELMDEVDQYFHIYRHQFWKSARQTESFVIQALKPVHGHSSRHKATVALQALFNRLSEECITPADFKSQSDPLACMYEEYLSSLARLNKNDMSLLQQKAFEMLQQTPTSTSVFKHLLIDEYQDTNTVQEKIFFHLAQGHKNICVVGDDDQALYRFRGATVENLVQFPKRCHIKLGLPSKRIDLLTNYRSCPQIVDFYNRFIQTDADLQPYRFNKTITAHKNCAPPAITITSGDEEVKRCEEVAELVKNLWDAGKVNDPNEIAFLYPSVKSPAATSMIRALEEKGLSVYSPRSGLFLQSEESMLIFGLMAYVLGKPQSFGDGGNYAKFHQWLDDCERMAGAELSSADESFGKLLDNKKSELAHLGPSSSTDWNLLDLYYQFLALDALSEKLALAEKGGDEGPACNLSLISQYLFRFQKMHDIAVMTGKIYGADGSELHKLFFTGYLYGLFRLQESDYEDADNPFPKGRIPFLTIHQAKGLEFPVVVLGSLNPFVSRISVIENLVRPLNPNAATMEPLNLVQQFDAMRLFYVALSRAENLLVLVDSVDKDARQDKRHPGLVSTINQMRQDIPSIAKLKINQLPAANPTAEPLPKTYSYTMDYQAYQACPRHYMLFRKYGFAPSRTRTMAFGVLVHKTIEDLHRYFIKNGRDATLLTDFIADRICENYQVLSQQTAHQLSKTTLNAAKDQVDGYWQNLPNIARSVTDVEVPLTLPGQTTPRGKKYSIYGVVDLAIQNNGAAHIYDIKTHAADTISTNSAHYAEQLNVYAHIWSSIHGKTLSGTSIIATKLPDPQTPAALAAWNPLVPLKFSAEGVTTTIAKFGDVVDQIEQRNFQPRSINTLTMADSNTFPGKNFAQDVCNQCDGRFSCTSYSAYLEEHPKDNQEKIFTSLAIDDEHDPSELGKTFLQLPMCKDAYLKDHCVQGFIDFLVELINGNQAIDHCYHVEAVNKHFPKHQLNTDVTFHTLQDAFNGYAWKRVNYAGNAAELKRISTALETAFNSKNEANFYQAALDCLAWGAGDRRFKLYTANRDWLWLRKSHTSLVNLFDKSNAHLTEECPNLHGFKTGHYRMNSGMTKIYAFTFDDFIIYDSRVAAALGRLVTKYCAARRISNVPNSLAFGWTGPDKRNPSTGTYTFPRLNNNSLKHAEWNIKANWLLKAVVDKFDNGFWNINLPADCLRALEAALFMVGYSLIDPKIPSSLNANEAPPNDLESDEECTRESTIVYPLSGRGEPIEYTGNIFDGFTVKWGVTRFSLDELDMEKLIDKFQGTSKVPLGAAQDCTGNPDSLGVWIGKNLIKHGCRYASAIAPILKKEGFIINVTRGQGFSLDFARLAD